MISVDEALNSVLARSAAPSPERACPIALSDSVGRVLARDVIATCDLPPFARSTVDGYTVRVADAGEGVRLRVAGESAAGAPFRGRLAAGTAVKTFTGGEIPACDEPTGVVMIEDVAADEAHVTLRGTVRAGQNVSPQGEDLRAGTVAIAAGTALGSGHVPLLASLGVTEPWVVPRPRVAILPTGSELVAPERTPGAGQIREANSAMLAALVRLAGGEPVSLGIVRDDRDSITAAARRGLECDLLLLSGGSSVGDYDFTPDVLRELGVDVHFDRVALKPGKPTLFGTRGDRVVFGLPGNPISAFVTFHLFVRPALIVRAGGMRRAWPKLAVRLASPVKRTAARDQVLPAELCIASDGALEARFTGWHGSGDVTCLQRADALLFVPRGDGTARPGDPCFVTPLDGGRVGSHALGFSP